MRSIGCYKDKPGSALYYRCASRQPEPEPGPAILEELTMSKWLCQHTDNSLTYCLVDPQEADLEGEKFMSNYSPPPSQNHVCTNNKRT